MTKRIVFFTVSLLITACASTSRVSIGDKNYFKEEPKIVTKENRYFLRFRYTDMNNFGHYYFSTESKIENNKLVFYFQGVTSSTADAQGKLQFEEIISENKISLIKEGAVFWEESDKKLVSLKVEEMKENLDVVWNKRLKH